MPGDLMGVSLHRYGKNEKLFSGKDAETARRLFEELHWLQSTGRLEPIVPGAADLPPRLKQVLDALLKA